MDVLFQDLGNYLKGSSHMFWVNGQLHLENQTYQNTEKWF